MSSRDRISQAMVYGLKNLAINREDFVNRFGVDFTILYPEVIDQLLRANAVTLDDEWLRITPEHYIFTDDICRQFFLPEYANMMMAHVERPSEQTPVQVTA
jgi:coproporphyrinogen III oxidase-like Fe-S oxidoreductase